MADLDDRAQILLITGFALAVTFVGLALILNSVIYTENLATRSESTTSQAISHARDVEAGTEAVIEYVNEFNTSEPTDYVDLIDDFDDGFATVTGVSRRHQLSDGQVIDDERATLYRGSWITQTNASRDFTNVSGTSDWSPVNNNSDGARNLRIFVNDSSTLVDAPNAFTIDVNDTAGNTWELSIGPGNVTVDDGGPTLKCNDDGSDLSTLSSFWVNVSQGTVAGHECPGLDFAADLGPIQAVNFSNPGNIEGTYRFLVNKSEGEVGTTGDYGDTSGPFTKVAIFGAVVEVDFERAELVYRTDVRAIPEENDD